MALTSAESTINALHYLFSQVSKEKWNNSCQIHPVPSEFLWRGGMSATYFQTSQEDYGIWMWHLEWETGFIYTILLHHTSQYDRNYRKWTFPWKKSENWTGRDQSSFVTVHDEKMDMEEETTNIPGQRFGNRDYQNRLQKPSWITGVIQKKLWPVTYTIRVVTTQKESGLFLSWKE